MGKGFLLKLGFCLFFIGLFSLLGYGQGEITEDLKELYGAEQYDKIIKKHANKVDDYPARAIYYVGMAYYMKADDNNCLKLMDLSILKDNTDPDAHYIKGMTYIYMGQFNAALGLLKTAHELNPDKGIFLSSIGDCYFNLDKMEMALEAYQLAVEKETPTDRPFVMIPQVYTKLNDSESALRAFYIAKDKIDKTTSSYITVLYNIGLSELLNKAYDKAELALIELIDLDPKDYYSYAKLIQVYYGKKEFEKSEPYKEKLYEAYAQNLLKGSIKDMFCFDQFNWEDKLIQVYERFEEKEGELYYKHIFYIVDGKGNVEFRIQTENSPISEELGGPKYAVGMNKGNTHYTYTFIEEDFSYVDLKVLVIQILEENVSPVSSSTLGGEK